MSTHFETSTDVDVTLTYTYDAEGNRTQRPRKDAAPADDHVVKYV